MLVETQKRELMTAEKPKKSPSSVRPGSSPHAVSSASAVSSAPMGSAPFRYRADGEVDWGNMWDTFCALALDGGPPHRATMLEAPLNSDVTSEGYRQAVFEMTRGIYEISRLTAETAEPGWLRVQCQSAAQAGWLAEAIVGENVAARQDVAYLLLPVGEGFTVKGEIKNVITAVAKTTHYWDAHLATEVKQTLAAQEAMERLLGGLATRLKRLLGYR